MKALIQRVSSATVEVEGKKIAEISKGLLVFLCIVKGDTEDDLLYTVNKVSKIRVFEDKKGKMNLSLLDIKGEALVISQFTLAANTKKGNRPSFEYAEEPKKAKIFYEQFIENLKTIGIKTYGGIFGSHMKIYAVNDGPVTILIDSLYCKK